MMPVTENGVKALMTDPGQEPPPPRTLLGLDRGGVQGSAAKQQQPDPPDLVLSLQETVFTRGLINLVHSP